MPAFEYQFLNLKGKKQTGRIEALSEADAKERLRRQGILVLKLKELGKTSSIFRKKKTMGKKDLLIFTTQLSQLLGAGIPLYESLLSLEEQNRLESFHPLILTLCEEIKAGNSLSKAMAQFPDSFNTLYRAMVAAGESIGALDKTLTKLSQLLSKQASFQKSLTTALLYPLILMGFSCVVIILLLTFVIPSLEGIFEDREVNGFTSFVIGASHFFIDGWMVYLPLMGLKFLGTFLLLKSPAGKRFWNIFILKIPLLKTLLIHSALARFSRTMGTLLEGGVTILQAMEISRLVMRNPILEEAIQAAEGKIVEGSLLSAELKKSPYIPSLVPRMLAIGEEGGNTSLMFQKIADLYEEETEKTLSRITSLAQPIILLVMGAIVGFIMLAVLLPLTDINAFLQG